MFETVMIIDDSLLEQYLAETIIKNCNFGKEVISFNSPVVALAYLNSLGNDPEAFPDVILLDIYMPLMNGFDFLDKYMEFPDVIKDRCKVVMFSSSLSREDHARMKEYPIVSKYLGKPLSEEMFNNIGTL